MSPFDNLFGFRSCGQIRSTRRSRIVAPVNDKDLAARPYGVGSVLQQSPRELAVQNIEKQHGVDAARWQAKAFDHDITMPAHYVVQAPLPEIARLYEQPSLGQCRMRIVCPECVGRLEC